MNLPKYIYSLVLFPILFGCSEKKPTSSSLLVEGNWHLELQISERNYLPVDFILNKTDSIFTFDIINAEEVITITDVTIENKNITIKDPVFNSWFEGRIISPTKISGFWYKENEEYKIPFTAEQGIRNRFPEPKKPSTHIANIAGKWEVDFSQGTDDHYKAIGVFEQVDNFVTGTFITETGDYRYLDGNIYNNNLYLSTFDGTHAFLFKGAFINGALEGNFWSGTHWEEPWVAVKNDKYELTNPDSLTFLNEGYDGLSFTFPSVNGDSISLSDEKYNDKVVIVNIMGPWCPNCKDETAYLNSLYSKFNNDGLEIIALSFDKTSDFETSKTSLSKVIDFYNAKYDFLIAGKANKIEAAKALPMLCLTRPLFL